MSSRPFVDRHIGPSAEETAAMLETLGFSNMEAFMEAVVPESIRLRRPLDLPAPLSEESALAELAAIMEKNQLLVSHIGMGYYGSYTPAVIRRNILENPGWYTAYTPYQAEIAQGRLEALLNFQTMVAELTAMDIANASLLDEATAVAEAVLMARAIRPGTAVFAASDLHPQSLAVLRTRCEPLGIRLLTGLPHEFPSEPFFAAVFQYPATDGIIHNLDFLISEAHERGALAIVAADLLALTLIKPPGECGADIVVGSAQRFGVPIGGGGPHPAFLATREEHKRRLPGRLVGVSKDAEGRPALRLALQTREQHIRRDKATSNICTAQVLPAVLASMYAVYHGPEGLRAIARRVHAQACRMAEALRRAGEAVHPGPFFDTLRIWTRERPAEALLARARSLGLNLRKLDPHAIAIAFDETTHDLGALAAALGVSLDGIPDEPQACYPDSIARRSEFLRHPVFHSYRTETEMLRYIRRLEAKDLSLAHSMIPLGSCTMKLNAAAEMLPLTWVTVSQPHPYAPADQLEGFARLAADLEKWLGEITGLPAVSLQPNAGSQGEYAGLLAIRAWHASRDEPHRDICLVPVSAHGTNPASAVLAGLRVVPVACLENGDVSLADLEEKIRQHGSRLAALMLTYPSTHGVFEESVRQICEAVHQAGGQVYLDGANMNALVGVARPGDFGADVCHLNLHKTFCIPHGGGGPGVGPVCAAPHLAPFLPGDPLRPSARAVAGAPLGSASILVISWMYLSMMGSEGLRRATETAILNANYVAKRLGKAFPVLYAGRQGLVAHECILDLREWKTRAGIEVEDVAKRLMDFGFHAPTMSWPVPGTLMVEPTESESKAELDRFCEAMLAIREELEAIAEGRLPRDQNPLVHAPHTAQAICADEWQRPYSRRQGAFPLPWVESRKFWPSVARVDNAYGDRNLFCACPPVEGFDVPGDRR